MRRASSPRNRSLEAENAKLKHLLAEAHLDMHALKSVLGVKRYRQRLAKGRVHLPARELLARPTCPVESRRQRREAFGDACYQGSCIPGGERGALGRTKEPTCAANFIKSASSTTGALSVYRRQRISFCGFVKVKAR
jgi:hypothetical protein